MSPGKCQDKATDSLFVNIFSFLTSIFLRRERDANANHSELSKVVIEDRCHHNDFIGFRGDPTQVLNHVGALSSALANDDICIASLFRKSDLSESALMTEVTCIDSAVCPMAMTR
jgi:hypothetical protein